MAEGEQFAYSDFAAITEVGATNATFKVDDSGTAKLSNYEINVETAC